MNVKGMMKSAKVKVLIVATIILLMPIFFILITSASSQVYELGEKVKIEVGEIGDYVMVIETPSQEYLYKSNRSYFLFNPEELGDYEVSIKSGSESKKVSFSVVESIEEYYVSSGKETLDESSEEPTEEDESIEQESNQTEPDNRTQVGIPVKNKLEISPGENLEIKIPEVATNVSIKNQENESVEFEFKDSSFFSLSVVSSEVKNKTIKIENSSENLTLEYITPAPQSAERIISSDVKEVTVYSDLHYTDVLASTNLTEEIPFSKENSINIYWKEESMFLPFEAYDTNNNSLIDKLEWVVPHLSNQTFEIIIEITDAELLSSNYSLIANVFEELETINNIGVNASEGQIVRVTFEKELNSTNDITIYASSESGATIKVYEPNTANLIAQFDRITSAGIYKVYLDNLETPMRTFDLRVSSGTVWLDYVTDPSFTTSYFTGFEAGYDGWNSPGNDAQRSTTRSYCTDSTCSGGGTYSMDVKDNSAQSYTQQTFDLSTVCNGGECYYINLSFWAYFESSIDAGEELDVMCDGSTIWSCYPVSGNNPSDDSAQCSGDMQEVWTYFTINLSDPEFGSCTIDSSVTLRFESEYSDNGEESWIDGINITGYGNVAPTASPVLNSTLLTNMTTENLTCYPFGSDLDGDSIDYVYNWIVNGSSLATLNLPFNFGSSSSSTTDYSGDYTISSTATYVSSGSHDGSGYYEFDGASSLTVSSSMESIFGDTGTVMFWLRTAQTGSDTVWLAPGIFGVEQSGGGSDIFWGHINAAGNMGITAGNGATAFTTSAINDDSWHHIAMTRDSTSGLVEIYVDGELDTSATSSTGVMTSTFNEIGVIEDTGGTPVYYNGDLDDFLAFPTVLSAEQIAAFYNGEYDTIVSEQTSVGENYTCEIIPNDGYVEGSAYTSNYLLVLPYVVPITIGIDWIYPTEDIFATINEFFNIIVNVTCLTGDCGTINVTLDPVEETLESFESGEGGFTHGSISSGVDDWHRSSESAYSGTYSFKFGDTGTGTYSDNANAYLQSPTYTIKENSTFTFYHYMYSENDYDGGKLEYSVDGGAWTKVTSFNSGGYNGNINNWNSITGFTDGETIWDNTIGSAGAFSLVDVDMSPFASNDNITFRWLFASDTNANYEGWYVDYVNFSTSSATKGVVPMNSGTPFYTTTQNPYTTSSLSAGQSQTVIFSVNATGDLLSTHEFFVFANATSDPTKSNETSKINITIAEDLSPVNLTIASPVGTTDNPTPWLELLLNSGNPDTIWYNLDNGQNYTVCSGNCAGMMGAGLDSFSYREPINITGTGTELTDYQLELDIDLTSEYAAGHLNSDCSDIRFTDDSENLIDYYLESCETSSGSSKIWVEVPTIAASGVTTIYMYYGSSSATSTSSAEDTFTIYDDFEDGSVNPDWTSTAVEDGLGSTTELGGYLAVEGQGTDIWGTDDDQWLVSQSLSGDFLAEATLSSVTWASNAWAKAGLIVKDSTVQDTNYGMIGETMSNGITFQYNYNGNVNGAAYTDPMDFRVIKSGSTITVYYSSNGGSSWTQYGSQDISTTDPVEVGMSSTSHTTTDYITAYWDDFLVRSYLATPPSYVEGSAEDMSSAGGGVESIFDVIYADSEGVFDLNVFVNNSAGIENQTSGTFTIDMNHNFYDTFVDNHSVLSYDSGVTWSTGELNYNGFGSTSNFYDFEEGELGDDWTTYISSAYGNIGVRDEEAYSGTYSVIADSATTNSYELSELISTYDYTGATFINLSFWFADLGDEPNVGSDHTDHQNADGVYYTCDGSYWYHIYDLSGSTSWTQVNISITDDANFCSEINSSFAIKFTQYDNNPVANNDGLAWDDIRITYDGTAFAEAESRTMHTTDVIAEFTNVTWSYSGDGNVSIQLSADNGTHWYNATNNQDIISITGGHYLKYKAIFSGVGQADVSLLDLNITWSNTASPAPGITINSPSSGTFPDVTPILNVTLNGTANNLWYTLNGGSSQTICTTCSGTHDLVLYLQEGAYVLRVYADNSIGDQNSESVSFTIDMNGNYYDTYEDDSQIWSSSGAGWLFGNISYQDSITGNLFYETFENMDDWTTTGGSWSITAGDEMTYTSNEGNPGVFAIYDNLDMESGVGYNISFVAYDDDNDENALVFRYKNAQNHYKCAYSIQTGSGLEWGLFRIEDGTSITLDTTTAVYTENTYNDYGATIEDGNITCYLNGVAVMSALDSTWEDGAVGVYSDYHQYVRYDNYSVDAWTLGQAYVEAYPITTLNNIVEVVNVSWNEYLENPSNDIVVQISTDDGDNWHNATNGQGLSGTEIDKDLVYRILFDTSDQTLLSLLDLNITWSHTASPAPTITVTHPGDPLKDTTPIIETSLSGTANSYWYTINNGPEINICNDCSGSQPVLMLLEEGDYDIDFYANNTVGDESTESISFEVDMQRNYNDTFPDSSQIADFGEAYWMPGNITFSPARKTFFDNFDDGVLGSNWTTYGSNQYSDIDVRTENSYSGSYSVVADSSTDNNYELSELITSYDFTGASNIILDFYWLESGDETNAATDHTSHQNSDGAFFTCDGSRWYTISDFQPASVTDNTWTNVHYDLSADSDFCSEVNSSFAIKFTQYDNYGWGNDGIAFDNINITYDSGATSLTSHAINVSQNIRRISEATWHTSGTDVNNVITIDLSVDNGVNWFPITNGGSSSSFAQGNSLVYRANFLTIDSRTMSLDDLNITWEEPPSVTILYPENSYIYNSDITKMNYTVSVSGSSTLDSCWYTTNAGVTNTSVTCEADIILTSVSGTNTWTVYANDSEGAIGSDTVTFIVDTSAPSIIFINQSDDPLDEGANFEVYVNATDSGLDKVWITIWESVIGGAIKFQGFLSNLFGDLFKATVPTDTTYNGTYNYTIYANDSTGLLANYSGNFSILKMYFYPNDNPLYSDGVLPTFITGSLGLSPGSLLANHPFNIWFNGEVIPFENLTANGGTYLSDFNFTGRNDIFDGSNSENISYNGTTVTLVGTNTTGSLTGTLDAGALVNWSHVDWDLLSEGCSGTMNYYDGNSWGYEGTADTYIQDTTPTTNYDSEENILLDTSPDVQRGLLKFEDIFGYGYNKIPYDSSISAATLSVNVYDAGNAPTLYEILEDWDADVATYNGRLSGTSWSSTGLETSPSRSTTPLGTISASTTGSKSLSVTNLVASWNNRSSSNYGVVFIPGGSSGVGIRSSDYSILSTDRPRLDVTFSSAACAGIEVYVRTSQDQSTWSDWSQVFVGEEIPDSFGLSRYLQYDIRLGAYNETLKPYLWDIDFNYSAIATDSSGNYNYSWETPTTFGSYDMNLTSGLRTIQANEYIELRVQSGINPTVTLAGPVDNYWSSTSEVGFLFNATDLNGDLALASLLVDGVWVSNNQSELIDGDVNEIDHTFAEGNYTWQINVSDSSGLDDFSDIRTIFIDLTDPTVTLVYPENESSWTLGYMNLSFIPVDNMDTNLTCNVTLDGINVVENQNFTNATEVNVSSGAVVDGTHYWNVTCQDNAGRSFTSDTWNFEISDTPPTVVLFEPYNGQVMSSENVTFKFMPDDNSGITICELLIDGIVVGNETNPQLAKNTTIEATNIADGFHNWSVQCTDLSSTTVDSGNWTFGVDTVGPTIEIFAPDNNSVSSTATPDFDIRVTDAIDENLTCDLYVGESILDTFNATSGLRFNFTSSSIDDGISTWYLNCTDESGYSTTSVPRNIDVRSPPNVTLVGENDTYKSGTSHTVTYLPTDNSGFANCSVYLDGSINQTDSSISNGVESFFDLDGLTDGVHTYYVVCTDSVSLAATSETHQVTIDNVAPNVFPQFPLNEDAYMVNITFNFTATDDRSDTLNCSITVDSVIEASDLTFTNNTNQSEEISGISDGTHYWNLTCYDFAGNSNTSTTYNFTRYTAPGVNLVSPENESWLNYSDVTLTYLPLDDEGITQAELYLNGALDSTDNSITTNVNNDFVKTLSDGQYDWYVKVTDTSSMSTDSSVWRFYVDTVAPTIELGLPSQDQIMDRNGVDFNFTVTDNLDSNLTCDLYISGELEWSGNAENATETITEILLIDGDYYYQINCSDKAQNSVTSSAVNFTVFAPPIITNVAPANRTYTDNSTINFSYFPDDDLGLINCSIYMDEIFQDSSISIVPSVVNNFTLSGITEGTHWWRVECYDTDMNLASSNSTVFYRDISPPNVTLNSPADGSGVDANANALLSFTATDALDIILTCDVVVDGSVEVNDVLVTSGIARQEPISGLSVGTHYWNVTCWDRIGNTNTSETWSFDYSFPDLMVNDSSISFSNENPAEDESVTINATIYNIGSSSVSSAEVEFYLGDPDSSGVQIGSTQTISVSGQSSNTTSVTWDGVIGTSDIYVVVDYSGSITENSEVNNKVSKSIMVSSWHFFYGDMNTDSEFTLTDSSNYEVNEWNLSNFSNANIYVADYDSDINWLSLQAIGRDQFGAISSSDVTEIDSALGSSSFDDSVTALYMNGASINETDTFLVFGDLIYNVPVAVSINSSNFKTGILWDTSDDSGSEYDDTDKEDLIFVTKVNQNQLGSYETTDYEMRVPALLREYDPANSKTAIFYVELS